jgi:hypothetical protein
MWVPKDARVEPLWRVPLARTLEEGRAVVREAIRRPLGDAFTCLCWTYGCLLVSMFDEALELSDRAASFYRRKWFGLRRLPLWARRGEIERELRRYEIFQQQMARREPMRFERVTLGERNKNSYYLPHDRRRDLKVVEVGPNGILIARWPVGRPQRMAWSTVKKAALRLQEDSFEGGQRRTKFRRRTVELSFSGGLWEIDTTWIRPKFRHPQLLEEGIGQYVDLSGRTAG